SSGTPGTKQVAIRALSTIAAGGNKSDAQLAKRALSDVFESTRASVVQIVTGDADDNIRGTGVLVTNDGHVLTAAHVVQPMVQPEGSSHSKKVRVLSGRKEYTAEIMRISRELDLALLRLGANGIRAVPLRFADHPAKIGSEVIGIAYGPGDSPMA